MTLGSTNRKFTRILILFLVAILLPITAVPEKAEAATYRYRGVTYYTYSISVFVTVTVTFKKRSSACIDYVPRNVVATPGPLGSNAVFLSWDKPVCGTPKDGYQIRLTEKGGYDAGSASKENGSLSYSSGNTKYLNVKSTETKIMVEGFGGSKVVDLQIASLGQYGNTVSGAVTSNTAPVTSKAVTPTSVAVEEVIPNFSTYTGTSGIRVNWAPSSGEVSYYVVQFTDNLNQDLAHTELTAKNTTRELYIENYINGRYKIRVKTVGVDRSVAFSDYTFITAKYAPSKSSGSTSPSTTNKSEAVPVLPALTPVVKQLSSNPVAKTVTLSVTNYQPGYSWAFNTYSTIKAEIDSRGIITLSGVNSCGFSGIFIAVNRTGYLTGTANPEYEMKCVKLPAPTFGPIKSNTRGFTVQVTNYDPGLKYNLALASNSNATLTIDSSGLITATGVSSSSYDTLIFLSVTKDGFYSNQAEVRGFAVDVVYEPNLGAIYQTSEGVAFKVTNFDPQFTWYTTITGELPGRSRIDYSSGIVTVTPLRAGESVQLELAASKSGNYVFRKYIQLTGPAVVTQPALTPTIASAASQAGGFTAQVNNFNSFYSWSVSASAGTASISSTGLITVSGLAAGQIATVTVRTTRTGYSSGTSTVSGQASASPTSSASTVQPALTPTFATANSQSTGFTAQVTNYNSAHTWIVSTSAGSASMSTTGLITVSGLSAGQGATVTVSTSRTGYSSGNSTVSGQAAAAVVVSPKPALTPTFATAASQATGFTVQVSNYSSAYSWSVSSSAGSPSISTSGLIAVFGLTAGQGATVTVNTVRTGYSSGSATVSGQATAAAVVALQPALTPAHGTATSQATGFITQVSNYNSAYTWSVSSSAGSASISSTGLISVSGLSAGQSATVTTRTARSGYTSGASTVTGQATAAPNQPALIPAFSTPTKTNGGFYASITNYSSSYQWSASTTAGSVAVNSSGQVTVTGLTQGQTATVTVRNTRAGYDGGSNNLTSAAIVTSLTPAFGALSSAINGFWIVITNYDPTFTWTITSSQGRPSVFANGNLGVADIGRNTSVKVTVTATKNGISSSASTVGSSN